MEDALSSHFFKRKIDIDIFKKKNWCRLNFQSRDKWQKNQAMIFKNIYDDEEEIVLGGKPRKRRNILQMMIELPWRQTQIDKSITTTSTFCDFVKTERVGSCHKRFCVYLTPYFENILDLVIIIKETERVGSSYPVIAGRDIVDVVLPEISLML